MAHKLTHYFTNSVAALLAAFATALLLSNLASAKLTQPRDPLFAIPMDLFFWFLGLGALAVVIACIFMRQPRFKLVLILWFATNLVVYWFGLQWQGIHNSHGYFGSLAHTFNLAIGSTNILLNLLFLYLLIGSAVLLLLDFLTRPEEDQFQKKPTLCNAPATPKLGETEGNRAAFLRTLKISCTSCGGHIEFPTNFFGERIPCPHCKAVIILQKAPNLKMSCLACDGRIEFPAHAIFDACSGHGAMPSEFDRRGRGLK